MRCFILFRDIQVQRFVSVECRLHTLNKSLMLNLLPTHTLGINHAQHSGFLGHAKAGEPQAVSSSTSKVMLELDPGLVHLCPV